MNYLHFEIRIGQNILRYSTLTFHTTVWKSEVSYFLRQRPFTLFIGRIGEARKILEGIPDDLPVVIPCKNFVSELTGWEDSTADIEGVYNLDTVVHITMEQ